MKPVTALLYCLSFAAASQLMGQAPAIGAGGIVNGASFTSGAVAPGSIATIFGTNLASALAQASTVPLSTALGGVSVSVGSSASPLLFVAPTQINMQVPFDSLPAGVTTGTVNTVVSRTDTASSAPAALQIAAVAPGIFQVSNHAIAVIFSDGALAAAPGAVAGFTSHAATAGDVLIIYATGLGAVTPAVANGANSIDQLRNTVVTPTILVGGVPAKLLFSGLSPQFAGVNQINITVPAGVTAGNAVPLQIQAGTVTSTDATTIAIQ